jgi:hypothetical protein
MQAKCSIARVCFSSKRYFIEAVDRQPTVDRRQLHGRRRPSKFVDTREIVNHKQHAAASGSNTEVRPLTLVDFCVCLHFDKEGDS